ncbi:TolB family protein [Actinokineospora guangxiensis]|uniref:TolB family protein n=1 Tax=Actinokineospora guangxiensis TaxID=1490288 RepID=A0ABW0EHW0_9PSEU
MLDWLGRHRIAVGIASMVIVVAAAALYVVSTVRSERASAAAPGAAVETGLRFVDNGGGRNLVSELDPAGARTASDLACLRVYTAAGTTVCLRMSVPGAYEAAVFTGSELVRTVPLPGTPSRARVSASGRIVSWTVFVTGDSYLAPGGFSTRTGVLDLASGKLVESLEEFPTVVIEGKPDKRVNENFWGVTVAGDDNSFYATLASGEQTWLVEGDLSAQTLTTVREDAECPSLSPDETRVAYKKRAGRLGGWRLFVLDLASGVETEVPGSDGVDDQAAWLDSETLAYAKVPSGGVPTIYESAADGSGQPRELVRAGSSPSPRA